MKTVILFKGKVSEIPEFSAHLKSYPKNTTLAEYIKAKEKENDKGGKI